MSQVVMGLLGLWLLVFWSLVVRARLATGEWPHPRKGYPWNPDYQTATIQPDGSDLHAQTVVAGLLVLTFLVPFACLLLVAGGSFRRMRPGLDVTIGLTLGIAGVVLTVIGNAGGFFEWFID